MGILTITGQLGMDADNVQLTQSIQDIALWITQKTQNLSLLNLLFVLIYLFILYRFKQILDEEQRQN